MASIAGPPSAMAVMHTAMNAPEVPINKNVAGADAAQAYRLDECGDSADSQRGEHGPGEEGFASSGHPNHDGWSQYDAGNAEDRQLQSEAQGQQYRRLLVGFIADSGIPEGVLSIHSRSSFTYEGDAWRDLGQAAPAGETQAARGGGAGPPRRPNSIAVTR